MKCVILAAGISSRLYPLTASTPKCLLRVRKHTILEQTIQNVLRYGISEFVVVTGFCGTQITEFVRKTFPSLKVQFVTNSRFADTNNSYSLALAEKTLRGDGMLLMDSDIVFDHRILSEVLGTSHENCLAVRRTKTFDEEEVKVTADDARRIIYIGKEVGAEGVLGESIGVEKFSPDGVLKLFKVLQERVVLEGRENEFYEASFQQLIDSGVAIHAVDVTDFPCIEIDTSEDLRTAREHIAPLLD